MRIVYLKLENFIGLYNGMGRNVVEIDFSKGDNPITILSGGNGKGKSFIVSCLHPFSSTLDNRDKIIMDNLNGFKEIVYELEEDHLIKIKHHYQRGKTGKISMKSFISEKNKGDKKYTELNPNGTVKSFKELVYNILEVDEDYFKIARVGTNVTNFIDMSTAERKKYISLFLPDVDVYLNAHKIVNEKYTTLNKTIKFITSEIDKIDNRNNLEDRKTNLNNRMEERKKSLKKLNERLNKNEGILESIDPNGNIQSNALEKINTFKSLMSKHNSDKDTYTKLKSLCDNDKKSSDIRLLISVCENKIKEIKDKLIELNKEYNENNSQVEEIEIKLLSFEIQDLEELLSIKKELEERLNGLNSIIDSSNKLSCYDKITLEQIYQIKQNLNNYISRTDYILNLFDNNEVYNNYFDNVEINSVSDIKQRISDKDKELNKLEVNKRVLLGKIELAETLKKRPSNCSIDTCPFISSALQYKDVDKEIEEVELRINGIRGQLSLLENELEMALNVNKLEEEVVRLYNDLDLNILSLVFSDTFKPNDFSLFKLNLRKDKDLLSVDELKDRKEAIEERSKLDMEIKNIDIKIENASNKQDLIQEMNKNKERLIGKLQLIDNKIKDLNEQDKKESKEIIHLKDLLYNTQKLEELKETIKSSTDTLVNLKNEINSNKEIIDKIKVIKVENNELKENISTEEHELNNLNNEYDKIKLDIKRLEEFDKRKKELDKDYNNCALLRDTLSSTKGIPLIFIDLYLKKIKNIANDLLDITFKGKFFIEEFKVTESDFFISVRKEGGELVEDVSKASQGEQALISIALSFALIQQSTKNYNVLALDEMDSTLDSNNRRTFIEVVESQLKEMNVKQCFIISHNEAFDTYPVNLMLFEGTSVDLSDKEYMKNKKVIFKNK